MKRIFPTAAVVVATLLFGVVLWMADSSTHRIDPSPSLRLGQLPELGRQSVDVSTASSDEVVLLGEHRQSRLSKSARGIPQHPAPQQPAPQQPVQEQPAQEQPVQVETAVATGSVTAAQDAAATVADSTEVLLVQDAGGPAKTGTVKTGTVKTGRVQSGRVRAVGNGQPGDNRNLPANDGDAAGDEPVADTQPVNVATGMEDLPDFLTAEERVNIWVYEQVNRSVVHITTKGVIEGRFFDSATEGSGSGSVLDEEGHILTNYHVIEGADRATVTLFDGSRFDAVLVGEDPPNDVAVIKIEATPEQLFPVTLADSKRLRVGMRVYALGNPFGLERTLTTGIISSLDRTIYVQAHRPINSVIQIDASVNPGSSGGPLLDTRGRLIGMNTAIASKTGQSAGVGFAIPAHLITRVVPQLIAHGKVIRADVGIVKVYQTGRGLLVLQTVPGGPAEKAGIKQPEVEVKRRGPLRFETVDRNTADLIVGIDGKETKTASDFIGAIEERAPGDVIVLDIVRKNRRLQVPVTLGQQASR